MKPEKPLDDYPPCKNCNCKIGYWLGKPTGSGSGCIMFEKNTATHVSIIDWEEEGIADHPGDISIIPCEPCKCGCKIAEVLNEKA